MRERARATVALVIHADDLKLNGCIGWRFMQIQFPIQSILRWYSMNCSSELLFGGINKRLCLISTACGIKHSFLLSLNFFVNLCKFVCCFWWNAFEKLPLQVTKCRIWDLLTHLLYYTIPKKANRNHSVVKFEPFLFKWEKKTPDEMAAVFFNSDKR